MFDELLDANRRLAPGLPFTGIPGRAARGVALVTCMDTRIDPLPILGLSPGDAKILRNAGGRVTPDVLRSLVLATAFLGVTGVAVMHHTRCALAGSSDAEITQRLRDQQLWLAAGGEYLAMPDPDKALREDVEAVRRAERLPPGVVVEGWRYDVDTGLVDRVVPS